MTIGIDCHNLEGRRTGVGRYLINLLSEWSRLKSEHRFFLFFKNEIPGDVPRIENFRPSILKTQSTAVFMHHLLPKAAEKERLNLFFSPSYLLPIRISSKIKTAVTIHDISYEAHPEWFSWQNNILLRLISKHSAKKADFIISPSKFTKQEIVKYYPVHPEKIFIIPLGAEKKFKRIEDCQEINGIKRKYKIKDKFIFYVGSIFNRRFIPECIKSFAIIARKFPEYQFLIGGTNYTHPFIDIESLIFSINRELKREAILHRDYIDESDLPYLYNAAEAFIWLSSYEGFGLPLLEAMACGTAVITNKAGSLTEVVGKNAFFVENPQNIEEISKAMDVAIHNKLLRSQLREAGLKWASEFSWEQAAKKTLEIFSHEQK